MNKKIMFNILFVVMLIIGLTLIVYPKIKNKEMEKNIHQNLNYAEELTHEELQNNLETEGDYDYSAIDSIDITNVEKMNKEEAKRLTAGRLIIPSVEINLPIFNGITNKIMNNGVGVMKPNSQMGIGNFSLAGHYSWNKNHLLNRLTDIEIGTRIQITDNDSVYEYIVYNTKVVDPSEVEWASDDIAYEHGKPVITLMNCYYRNGRNTGDRYFVFGELSSVKSY